MRKPHLFVDVDGVVAPLIPDPDRPGNVMCAPPAPPGFFTWDHPTWGVFVNVDLPAWAAQLDELFSVWWASSWAESAPRLVGRPAGLPDWPVLPGLVNCGVPDKFRSVAELLDDDPRPFVWAEDDLPARDILPDPTAHHQGLPHLLVRPDRAVGLTAEHVDRMVRFAGNPAGESGIEGAWGADLTLVTTWDDVTLRDGNRIVLPQRPDFHLHSVTDVMSSALRCLDPNGDWPAGPPDDMPADQWMAAHEAQAYRLRQYGVTIIDLEDVTFTVRGHGDATISSSGQIIHQGPLGRAGRWLLGRIDTTPVPDSWPAVLAGLNERGVHLVEQR